MNKGRMVPFKPKMLWNAEGNRPSIGSKNYYSIREDLIRCRGLSNFLTKQNINRNKFTNLSIASKYYVNIKQLDNKMQSEASLKYESNSSSSKSESNIPEMISKWVYLILNFSKTYEW